MVRRPDNRLCDYLTTSGCLGHPKLWIKSQNQKLAVITMILVYSHGLNSGTMDMIAPLAVLLCFSAICYMLLAARLFRQTDEVGHVPIGLTFAVIGVWVLGGAIELVATSYVVFSVGRIGHFIGTAIVPVTLLLYFRQYTGRDISRNMIAALLIIPISSIVVAATNPLHEFMWYLPATNAAGQFLTHPVAWGPWVRGTALSLWLWNRQPGCADPDNAQQCRRSRQPEEIVHAGGCYNGADSCRCGL